MRGIDGRDYESLRGWLIFEDGTWRAHKDHCPCSRRGPGPLSGRSRHEPAGKTGWIGIRSRILAVLSCAAPIQESQRGPLRNGRV
jgi:hypothetical protein